METEVRDNTTGGLVLRPFRDGDEEAILVAFNRVFAATDVTFEPRSMSEWNWRFRQNPAGRRIWVAVTGDGEVVAQQAGMPLRVRMGAETVLWNHIVDSFADPRFARGLKKPGLFVTLAEAFNDTVGGPGHEEMLVMIGMPVRTAYRIGHRFLRYRAVRHQLQLRAPVERLDAGPGTRITVQERVDFPAEVESLFERCAGEHAMIAVRDRAFLDWRFVRRPDHSYRIATARLAGELVGYAVFRDGAWDGEPAGLACDWLVDPAVPEAREALVGWLATCTREAGTDEVCFILSDTCADFRELQRIGFRARKSSYITTAGSFTHRFHTSRLHAGWYYTLAEFDLC